MKNPRKVRHAFTTKQFLEGAGVKLRRGFSYMPNNLFDPFLLFDDFSSENPVDYLSGFPWHPHRGIETVTYILKGEVEHGDSLGNSGVISRGDIQWMSSGSGIIHQEMPRGPRGLVGFQLWLNMPSSKKMSTPKYQEHAAVAIPEFEYVKGVKTRLISGTLPGYRGVITNTDIDPTYIDFEIAPNTEFSVPTPTGYTAFIYIFEGSLALDSKSGKVVYRTGKVILYDRDGGVIHFVSGSEGSRTILVMGKPINEPVAWHGPVVMNTHEELALAFRELNDGSFIKSH